MPDPTLSVTALDPAGLLPGGCTLKVDGASIPRTKYVVTVVPGGLTITYKATGLVNGGHTVTASVLNRQYRTYTYSWSFTVSSAPVVSALTPPDGTTVGTATPTISAIVTDSSGAAPELAMTLDGVTVPASYDPPTRTFSYKPHGGLRNETTHEVVLVATNAAGASTTATWSFSVQLYPSMTDGDCGACHAGYPAPEHAVDDCAACHGALRPVRDCSVCHPGTHGPETLEAFGCEYCHSSQWEGIVPGHYADLDSYHLAPAAADCTGCHSSILNREHARYTDEGGEPLGCATCHGSTDPLVAGAVAAEDTRCEACHPGAGDHLAVHDSALGTGCADCHDANLVTEHVTEQALTCETCHESADPAVSGAIAAGDLSCTACHPGAGDHAAVHGSTLDPTCADCHDANLVTEHVTEQALTCETCHESADPAVAGAIAAGNLACSACHPGAGDHLAVHDSALSTGCADCHDANLVTEHVTEQALTCETCHESTDPAVAAAIAAGDLSCTACHDLAAHPYPLAAHQAGVADATASGTLYDRSGTPFRYYDGVVMTYANQRCGQCHLMDLLAEHTKPTSSVASEQCAACHATPRDTFGDWNQTCQQGGCHATYHGDIATKHYRNLAATAVEAGCGYVSSDCHQGEWHQDLGALHSEAARWGGIFWDLSGYPYGCAMCHGSPSVVPPAAVSCRTCHTTRHGPASFPY